MRLLLSAALSWIASFTSHGADAPTPVNPDLPNLLWITVEDMSPTLGCYGDSFAHSPALDAFAKESVIYTHCFAASPVCSPARSTLITGLYNAGMGTHQMRSSFPLPKEVKGFPSYLRSVGYHTSNHVKTDYNCAESDRLIAESWDQCNPQAHWRNRKPEQPFFAVFNDMTTHQSRTMTWPYAAFQEQIQSRLKTHLRHDPKKVPVPPYYPDTPSVRRTLARFYDCVTVMDENVRDLLDQLKADGLAENTIVFFYSDHGSGLPRHKRVLLDSGMQVPLMVRFPEKFRHLAPAPPGTRLDRLVSFVDFPASILNLVGLPVPPEMQGIPFLGPNSSQERDYLYGSRDRVDEAFEMSRSLRDKQYLYLRHYLPHLSYHQPSAYSDLGEISRAITGMAQRDLLSMSAAQQAYAGPRKPVEEFYDCLADPQNLRNLFDGEMSPLEQEALRRFRENFAQLRLEIGDVGVFPESVMWDLIQEEGAPLRDIFKGKTSHAPDLATAWKNADLVGSQNREALVALLSSPRPEDRYWALIGLRVAFPTETDLHHRVIDHLDDIAPLVRIEAASWLAQYSDPYRSRALQRLGIETAQEDWWKVLHACRSIELLGTKAQSLLPEMRRLYEAHRPHSDRDGSLFIAFSSGAFLEQFGEKTVPWDFAPATARK